MDKLDHLKDMLAASRYNVDFYQKLIKEAEEEAKKITMDDIVLGRQFVSGNSGNDPITILPYGWQAAGSKQFYSMGGCGGNPFRPYSNMQGVTAYDIVQYLIRYCYKK